MTQPNLAQAGNASTEAVNAAQEAANQSAQATSENAENNTKDEDTGSGKQPAPSGDDDADAEDFKKKYEDQQKHIKRLNDESAKHRNAAKSAKEAQDALKEQILKVFGSEEAQSPEDALKAAQAEAQKAQAELTRYKETDALTSLVKKAKGNPDVVIPYLRGTGNLPEFGADDYNSQVEQIIKDTLEAQPGLRAQVAPTSSGQSSTPNGGEARINREDLKGMTSKEIRDARRAGKLDHLFTK